jgi:FkbM family methyltransferase
MMSTLRKCAQSIRHAPVLRSLTPVWSTLREPYLRVMHGLGSRSGIVITVGGTQMRLHPEFATQNWETVEAASYRAFAALLKPGDVVFDLGAHIGTYTLTALSRIGPKGCVIAYEPHEFTRRHLARHVEWSAGADRIVIRPVCCAAAEGRATFYSVPDRAEGMNGLVPVDGFERTLVHVTTIDREVHLLGVVPTVLKIDVEGAEWDVLKGAEATLANYHPRICLSLHTAALRSLGATPELVLRWLADLGYQHHTISDDHELHVIAEVPDAPASY